MAAQRPHRLTRRQATAVAAAEMRAFGDVLASLDGDDWDRDTDSAGWTVRHVAAHVTGQYEELARPAVLLRRLGAARRRYRDRSVLDGHNQVQIDDLGGLGPDGLRARYAKVGPAAVRMARIMPGFVRRVPSRKLFPGEALAEPDLGYLIDVVAPRDTWMHRLEVARATGVVFEVDAHDEAIVGQVMRDLHAGWRGRPLHLELTGPAGGTWAIGRGPALESAQVDTLALMRHLSGRGGLDLPPDSPLADARVVF